MSLEQYRNRLHCAHDFWLLEMIAFRFYPKIGTGEERRREIEPNSSFLKLEFRNLIVDTAISVRFGNEIAQNGNVFVSRYRGILGSHSSKKITNVREI